MLRVAIVDDDEGCAKKLREYLATYQAETNGEYEISAYRDGLSFLEGKRSFDLVFLDIDMPLLNGLEAAHRFREKDENAVLIFVTSLAQYAIKGYEVNALDFLVKPVGYSAFSFAMKRAEKAALVNRGKDLVIETRDGIVRRQTDELCYVEVRGHSLTYHFTDDTVETRGRLGDAETKLDHFLRCNNCYLINPRHIDTVRGYEVTVSGDMLTISHPRKKQFMEELGQWYARYGG